MKMWGDMNFVHSLYRNIVIDTLSPYHGWGLHMNRLLPLCVCRWCFTNSLTLRPVWLNSRMHFDVSGEMHLSNQQGKRVICRLFASFSFLFVSFSFFLTCTVSLSLCSRILGVSSIKGNNNNKERREREEERNTTAGKYIIISLHSIDAAQCVCAACVAFDSQLMWDANYICIFFFLSLSRLFLASPLTATLFLSFFSSFLSGCIECFIVHCIHFNFASFCMLCHHWWYEMLCDAHIFLARRRYSSANASLMHSIEFSSLFASVSAIVSWIRFNWHRMVKFDRMNVHVKEKNFLLLFNWWWTISTFYIQLIFSLPCFIWFISLLT